MHVMLIYHSRAVSLSLYKMIRELATKKLASPSRNHLHIDATMFSKGISRKREIHPEGSKNVDALKPNFEEEDSEIEISGPFPLSFKPESTKIIPRTGLKHAVVQKANDKPIHPFFRSHIPHASSNGPHFALRAVSSAPATQLRLKTASLNEIATSQNANSRKHNSLNTFLNSNSLPDAHINQFPIYSYKCYKPLPTVVYTQHEEEANDLIAGLKPGPVAFDMEWRFCYIEREYSYSKTTFEGRTAVVQVADSSGLILVIQINKMIRFPIELQSLLENPDIPKLGVNILNDGRKLFRDYGILAQNLVELGALALLADPAGSKEKRANKRKIVSLVKLVQWYCGMEVEKGDERVSNWELKLNKRQIDYAANDVHSSMEVYQKLCNIAQLNAITLDDKKSSFTSDVTLPSSEKYLGWYQSDRPSNPASSQSIRAYHFWHHLDMTLDNMCAELSLKRQGGLKPTTVITYIIAALKADPSRPYSLPKLIKLVQMDVESWILHREWIVYVWNQNLVAV